jgi:hypothetical protein
MTHLPGPIQSCPTLPCPVLLVIPIPALGSMGCERCLDKAESAIQQTGRYFYLLSAAAPGGNVRVTSALLLGVTSSTRRRLLTEDSTSTKGLRRPFGASTALATCKHRDRRSPPSRSAVPSENRPSVTSEVPTNMNAVALTLDDLASQITAEHFAAIEDARSAVKHARKAGEYLLQAKEGCRHGDWLSWLREHCSDIPERMAQRYMQVAGHPELEADSLREALFKLAAPRQPSKATRVSDLKGERAASVLLPASDSEPDGDPPDSSEDDGIPESERLTDGEMLEQMEFEERQYQESIQKVMEADDTLSAANAEIKRQAAEIAALKTSRDGFMNGKAAIIELLKAEQAKTARQSKLIDRLREEMASPADTAALQQQVERLIAENEKLRERIAIMEESA